MSKDLDRVKEALMNEFNSITNPGVSSGDRRKDMVELARALVAVEHEQESQKKSQHPPAVGQQRI
jgi:hypothetical protein